MVARIIKEGELVGIHRTFLDPDGSGVVSPMQIFLKFIFILSGNFLFQTYINYQDRG